MACWTSYVLFCGIWCIGVWQLHVTAKECIDNQLGLEYDGTVSTTDTGKTCQYWSPTYPHDHHLVEELGDQHNYCRNADNEPFGPWCYTTDDDTRWEYCTVPHCDSYDKSPKPGIAAIDCIVSCVPKVTNYGPGKTNYTYRKKCFNRSFRVFLDRNDFGMTLYRFKRAQMIFLLDSGHFIGYFTVSCREINAGSIPKNAQNRFNYFCKAKKKVES